MFTRSGLRAHLFIVAAAVATFVMVSLVRDDGATRSHKVAISGQGAAPADTSRATVTSSGRGTFLDPQQEADAAAADIINPLPASAFRRPIARYRVYAARRARTLAVEAAGLTDALRAGDRGRARAAWARADSSFARIGAAYGALDRLGDAIDGSPGGLPLGVRDPRFTGLRRIEWGLWTGQPPASLVALGERLQRDVGRLRTTLASSPIDPLTYATRAHEILEDVQRDPLGSPTPSGQGVRATADGLAATRVVLATLDPVLAGRGSATDQARAWMDRLGTTLASIRRAHGGTYPTVAQLSRGERNRLTGQLGASLEALSGIPELLETRLPPKIPRLSG